MAQHQRSFWHFVSTRLLARTLARTLAKAPASLLFAVFAFPAVAEPVDTERGGRIAQRWCASCHIVSPAQKTGAASAPTFAKISATMKVNRIKGALIASHTRMPDMVLTSSEVDDLIGYIQTLAPPLDPVKPRPEKDNPPKTHRG